MDRHGLRPRDDEARHSAFDNRKESSIAESNADKTQGKANQRT
jgi:hypothetical protein